MKILSSIFMKNKSLLKELDDAMEDIHIGERTMDTARTKTDYRLLVIDDEPQVRSVLKRALGYAFAVDVAESGAEALRLFREESYDVVLTDLSMPGMQGYEVARALKQQSSHIIVILVTGDPVTPQDLKGWDIDFLVEKPFDLEHLLGVIGEAIRRRMAW
jgi:DNA-binding response OmpR family regulator